MKIIFRIMLLELKRVFEFKTLFLIMVLSIFLYALLYPQPYIKQIVHNLPVVVVDQDNSYTGRELIRKINTTDNIKTTTLPITLEAAKGLLRQGKAEGIIVIPQRFEQLILANKSSPIFFFGNGNYIINYNYVYNALTQTVKTYANNIGVKRQITQSSDTITAQPFAAVNVALFNPQASYATYIIPPAFVLILQQTLLIGCLLLGLSKGKKEQDQLAISYSGATLYSSLILILGRLLAYLTVYGLHFMFYIICVPYFYKLPQLGQFADLVAVGFPFLLAVSLMGLCGSLFIKRIETVFILLLPLGIPFFFLSGIPWPFEAMQPIITQLAKIIPSSSGIDALVRLNQMGAALFDVKPQLLNLWTLVSIYGVIALIAGRFHLKYITKSYLKKYTNSNTVVTK